MTDGPRTLHRGAFLELVDRDGWEYVHRFATRGVVVVIAVDHGVLLLVEQFRPAQNAAVLALPGGLVDAQDAVGWRRPVHRRGGTGTDGGDRIRRGAPDVAR